MIYWSHELHESNEYDFCGFLFEGFMVFVGRYFIGFV